MKQLIFIVVFLLVSSLVYATDYLDEFSFDGQECFYVDEFDYIAKYSENTVTIIGCCDLYECFYFPMDLNSEQTFPKSFEELLQIESARQNIIKNNLSNEIFKFEEFFDFCNLIELDSPESQIVGGIVDITDNSLPYLVNVEKARDFHNVAKLLKGTKLISKFDIATFSISSACSFGDSVEDDVLKLLSNCHNSFQRIKYGRVNPNELTEYDICLLDLKEETVRKEGFWGSLTEITYMISSLLTGGNIVEFVRDRMPTFESYATYFNEDIIDIENSIHKFNAYYYSLNNRMIYLKDSIKEIKRNVPFWHKVKAFFGFKNQIILQIDTLNELYKNITIEQDHYRYKTANLMVDDAFVELNTTFQLQKELKPDLDINLFCDYNETYYDVLEKSKRLDLTYYNQSTLVDSRLQKPKNQFVGMNTKQYGCGNKSCIILFHFLNEGQEALIDFNSTITVFNEWENITIYHNVTLKNIILRNGLYKYKYQINLDNEHFILDVTKITNISISVKPNDFYSYIVLPYPNMTIVPINVTKTVSSKSIFCYIN